MFSILIAGGLFGFFGMLLGVPIFAIVYYIIQKVVKGRMARKKLPTTTEKYVELQSIDEKTLEPVYETQEEEN
jgi:predicted PurR-regulated permease PerM